MAIANAVTTKQFGDRADWHPCDGSDPGWVEQKARGKSAASGPAADFVPLWNFFNS
jgi:hypothetical protein